MYFSSKETFMASEKKTEIRALEAVELEHRQIIDEYFANGFDQRKAVKKYRPHIKDGSSYAIFSSIMKKASIKEYVAVKREGLRSSLAIKQEVVLHNLMAWLRADATDFIGLTPDEVKALPSDVRRSIQQIKHNKREYTDRQGNLVVDEKLEVKMVDKLRVMDMINKHIDFYNADNQSKKQTVDISNATPEQLNTVLSLLEGQLGDNKEKTIDADGESVQEG